MNNVEVNDMKRILLRLLTVGVFMAMSLIGVNAQSFLITQVELEGVKLNIYYDLIDNDPTHKYTVKLFSSRDNFVNNLRKVSGDVGLQVSPGTNKKIVWNISDEFGDNVEEKISFQVKGSLYEPFLKMDQNYTLLKRGKSYEYSWTGGSDKDILNLELLSNDLKIVSFPSFSNEGRYTLKLPTSLKPGKSYKLKIYDSNDPDKITFTNEFEVRRKVPVILKVLPFVVIGSAVYYFMSPTIDSNQLPDPIKP